MEISDYKVKAIARHLKRIVEYAKCDPNDTLTRNALRLAKIDLRILDKLIGCNSSHTES